MLCIREFEFFRPGSDFISKRKMLNVSINPVGDLSGSVKVCTQATSFIGPQRVAVHIVIRVVRLYLLYVGSSGRCWRLAWQVPSSVRS
jgi:hypothetical protein